MANQYKRWELPTGSKQSRYQERRKLKMLNRHGWWCHYCRRPLMLLSILGPDIAWWTSNSILWPMTIEHLVPIAIGGTSAPENLVPCCYPCNQKIERPRTVRPGVLHYNGQNYRYDGKTWVEVE